ncbi:MAG: cytochrome family [Mycobacterium sp.]|nr:cytochrome family [Mycobacterium sp.]
MAKETLRIRPVVFDVGRVLKEPVELAGYQLPAGVVVVPGIVLVHSNSEVYPDADRFDPDRMVGATLSPTTWFPFGGGNRRCLGATFAMVEMRVVLREILRRVELATTSGPGERQRVKHVILVPRHGPASARGPSGESHRRQGPVRLRPSGSRHYDSRHYDTVAVAARLQYLLQVPATW